MKTLVLFLFSSSFLTYSQSTDSDCISERYISISQNEQNSALFGLDTNALLEQDLVHIIRKLVKENKLNIYKKQEHPNGRIEWSYIDYEEEFEKAVSDSLNIKSKWRPYFSIWEPQSDIPLTDEYGDPILRVNEEGWEEYVYPAPEVYEFSTKDVDEIHIREYLSTNSKTKKEEFRPILLSFYFNSYKFDEKYEIFWVNINELFEVLMNKEKYPWYQTLNNRSYSGFQYEQVRCDDYNRYYMGSHHPLVIKADENCQFNIVRGEIYNGFHLIFKLKKDCDEMVIKLPTEWENAVFSATRKVNEKIHPLVFTSDKGKNYRTTISDMDKGDYQVFFRFGCFAHGELKLSIE